MIGIRFSQSIASKTRTLSACRPKRAPNKTKATMGLLLLMSHNIKLKNNAYCE